MKTLFLFLRRAYLRWRLRHIPDDLCCCGETMGRGGEICRHGGCRSAKEYATYDPDSP